VVTVTVKNIILWLQIAVVENSLNIKIVT